MQPIAHPGILESRNVISPVHVAALAQALSQHPDQGLVSYLVQGFSNGFSLGVRGTVSQGTLHNLKSALDNPEGVSRAIKKEVARGHTHGPFLEPPFNPFHTSPIGVVEKKDGSFRLILDLSDNHAGSVNECIAIEDFSISYCSVDDAVALVIEEGPQAYMAKVDIQHAFRLCPVRPDEWPLLCFRWVGAFYFDSRLPFGLRSSPFIFNTFADALLWCLSNGVNVQYIIHYLDDFFFCRSSFAACQADMRRLMAFFTHLGVPLAPDKVCGPVTRLTFLGIEIDTAERMLRLPEDKVSALMSLITSWKDRRRCTKRELLSLIGHLSFAAKVVKPGRLFLRRLIDISTTVHHLNHRIHLSMEAREDIRWWLSFLPSWNGVSLFQEPPISSNDLHLYTDASSIGMGGVFGNRWFSVPLSLFQDVDWFPCGEPFNVNFWELLALVVAFFTWQQYFSDRQLIIHTDNLSLVYIWSRGSRNHQIMRLVRALFTRAAHLNANIVLQHIPGHINILADSLSRLQVHRFREDHPTADPDPSPIPTDLWHL